MPIRQFRRPDGSTAASARPINSSSQDHGSILSTVYSSDSTAAGAVAAAGTTTGVLDVLLQWSTWTCFPRFLFLLNSIAGWMKDLPRPARSKTALQKSYKNYYLSAIG